MTKVGFLHPGEMGISLAASALNSEQEVFWCSAERSSETLNRANTHHLTAVSTLQELCDICDIVIAVCPPHAASTQAQAVINAEFKGTYADVNAISPDTVKVIAEKMEANGISFVDGGIIGLPAWKANTTWLHLCGLQAELVAKCFKNGPLETNILTGKIGQASALKMCFAANSKGVSALITAILATAEEYDVRKTLEKQWDTFTPEFTSQTQTRIKRSARKAWRFQGEMEEIAATLKSAGLPEAFHLGAADVYSRQASFKNLKEEPSIEEILKVVNSTQKKGC